MRVELLQPFGAVIYAECDGESILALERDSVARLIEQHQLLLLRGYAESTDIEYAQFAKQFGPLLNWEFGEIFELKIKSNPANHLFTQGRVELHWDGAYVDDKPHYNVFQCLEASEDDGGETLFVNTLALLDSTSPAQRHGWRDLVITYRTEKKAHYGGSIRQSLCSSNPYDQREVIRYIEAFNEDCAELNPVTVKVENYSQSESDQFLRELNRRMYRDDVMYKHRWQRGDYLIADNSTLLHGRSRFNSPEAVRRIKRINVL